MPTVAEVKAIIGSEVSSLADDDSSLGGFITQAETFWANVSGGESCGNSDAAIDLIERYLAAHFWAVTNERGGLREIQIGNSREEYASGSYTVSGLSLTRFGQQALAIDISGKLKAHDSMKLPALFKVFK